MRIVRWVVPAAALGVAGLGMAASADIEDSWCAPQTSCAGVHPSGDAMLAMGGGMLVAAGSVVGVSRRLLRRRG
jgi:hypothetical protein